MVTRAGREGAGQRDGERPGDTDTHTEKERARETHTDTQTHTHTKREFTRPWGPRTPIGWEEDLLMKLSQEAQRVMHASSRPV